MTRSFAICHGAGLDYCANCQRWCDNQPEASKDPHQAWIPEATSDHCAYYQANLAGQDLIRYGISLTRGGKRIDPLTVFVKSDE